MRTIAGWIVPILGVTWGCGGLAPEAAGNAEQDVSGSRGVIDNGSSRPHVAAVGRLLLSKANGDTGACSGTLVTRTHVLTAAHCFNGVTAQAAGTFTIPNGAAIPNPAINKSFPITAWKRAGNTSAHDVAVLTLGTEVPPSVVPTLARVFTGGIKAAWSADALLGPGTFVGFGGTIPRGNLQDDPTDGNRRFGVTTETIWLHRDPCDLLDTGRCTDDYQIEVHRISDPQPERGDSGGPLYMSDANGLIIVGVWKGSESETTLFSDEVVSVWAATGNPGGTENGTFITTNIGSDADGDGVLDPGDNCKPTLCTGRGQDKTLCANPDQADDDGDGIGDACDNCRQVTCDAYGGTTPPNFTCNNPSQADLDGDGRGDACDICPLLAQSLPPTMKAADRDSDGVGDFCDPCTTFSSFAACIDDVPCGGGTCIREAGQGFGHCSALVDGDNDGMPNVCDACPTVSNLEQGNANDLAENRERLANPAVAKLGDACDPVPLVRLPSQKYELLSTLPSPGDGTGPDDLMGLEFSRWVGVDAASPLTVTSGFRRTTFRHCSCTDPQTGNTVDMAHCVGAGMPCDWSAPRTASTWRRITIKDGLGNNLLDADGWSLPQLFTTNQSFNDGVNWAWREDAVAGRVVPIGGACTMTSGCVTHGALFSTVEAAANGFGARDQQSLRDSFSMRDTPGFIREPIRFIPLPIDISPVGWIVDGFRDPFPVDVSRVLDRPRPILTTPTGVLSYLRPDFPIDASRLISPAIVAGLRDRTTRWLSPVESRRTLRARADFSQATSSIAGALLDRNMTRDKAPLYVIKSGGALTAVDPMGEFTGLPGVPVGGGPTSQSGVVGALSMVDASVFMLGGTLANGRPANSVWRWDFATFTWRQVLTGARHPPSSNVLATTYDSRRRMLFVLDVDDDDYILTSRVARLIRYDMVRGTSVQLLRVPYSPLFQKFGLSVLEDSSIVLVAGKAVAYSAWRMDVSTSIALPLGVKVGIGTMLDAPVMGEDRPYLPVRRLDFVDVDDLGATSFLPGALCDAL